MDSSDPLRDFEFFSMPSSQTVNPIDPPFLSGTSTQPPSIWETAGLNVDTGLTASPSTAPTSLSLDSVSQPSTVTGFTTMSPDYPTPRSTAQAPGSQSRPVLPARGPRTRHGHERKRSRLSQDPSPLDSVDYWLNFDKDENQKLASVAEGLEPSEANEEDKNNPPSHAGEYRPTNPAPPAPTLKREELFTDSALESVLSDDDGFSSIHLADHLSRIESAAPRDVPPREGLYSTPLSWEKPQPGIRMDTLMGLQNPALNATEQRQLMAIAMNPGPNAGGLGSTLNFDFGGLSADTPLAFGAGLGDNSTSQGPKPVSPPQPPAAQPRPAPPNPPKKQGNATEKGKHKPRSDRAAHNDIERKYRTNLKDKIAELREAVPSLRTKPENGGPDDGTQASRPAKVSKGTVLTKATEYIHFLERRNKEIVQEHRELSRRLQTYEQLLNAAAARSSYAMPSYSRTLFDPRGFC